MIKLIAIDLDGTLLDEEKNISNDNIKAIKECTRRGIKVVIATGRPINGVLPILKKLGLTSNNDYVITYNGAKVFNVGTKHDIFTSTIDGKAVSALYQEALRMHLHYHAFRENEELITIDHNIYTNVEVTANNIEDHIYDFNLVKPTDKFIKAMLVDDPKNIDYAIKNVDPKLKNSLTMVRSSGIYLEFLNPNTSKGLALRHLASHLGVDMSETMAIGDAGNDLPMLMAAGIGVCMANGHDDVIEKCKYHTSSNEESGVARAIEKYALGL